LTEADKINDVKPGDIITCHSKEGSLLIQSIVLSHYKNRIKTYISFATPEVNVDNGDTWSFDKVYWFTWNDDKFEDQGIWKIHPAPCTDADKRAQI
tara:strand:- start:654 stop:941 length:288 start_codon:yes stop_codon:yes gene_type:complete